MIAVFAGNIFVSASMVFLIVYLLAKNIRTGRFIKIRKQQILLYASRQKDIVSSTIPLSSALYEVVSSNARDIKVSDGYTKNDWGFGDFNFSFYSKGTRTSTVYFSVGVIKLARILPNVFFDSKSSGKMEFKKLFKRSQLHSLEGNFDDFFDTYFAEDYQIDNLSFITPEVMQAILEAKEYDVEIYKDKLYLYQELKEMPAQMIDIEDKCKLIRAKLNNNIHTYRDQRIDYSKGRRTVSIQGIELRRSMLRYYLLTFIGFAIIALAVVSIVWFDVVSFQILLLGGALVIPNLQKIIKSYNYQKKINDLMQTSKDAYFSFLRHLVYN